MKRIGATATFILMLTSVIFSQNLTQTVRGTLVDADSKLPLIGANVILLNSNPIVGATTDENGHFKLTNISVGRIALKLSYIGYENAVIPNIVVNSGKEVVLDLSMQESTVKMEAFVVTVDKNKGEAQNDMAMISARSISPEETSRYAGGFNDPSRIVSSFAGVTNSQDGGNDIIVRGNSPKYIQWRLEGEQMTNPNHFGDQSGVGGSISTLNNNVMAKSDFYTGAFAPEYGDVLSGVYDVKLRAGNNEKFEAVFGFGLLGTDLTLEGPFKKGYGGSYLINYRYSTVGLASDLKLVDGIGLLKYQDASFKVVLPTRKLGVFSIYGLGGRSNFTFEDVSPTLWSTPGDRGMLVDVKEDFEKKSHLFNTGISHTLSLNDKSYLKTTLAYANEGIEDAVFESKFIKIRDSKGVFLRDSTVAKTLNFNGQLTKPTYRGSITYNNKINARSKLQIGTKYTLFDYDFNQSQLENNTTKRISLVDFKENISTIRNFVSWKYRINDALTMVSGFHNMNVLFNKKSTFEPRLALDYQFNAASSVHVGYGNHSTMEAIHHYFAKVKLPNGTITEPNRDLDLLKANHFVVGYEQRFGKNMRAKIEAYYQDLYNLPVENNDTSYYATINEGLEFRYIDLVNKGTGENYGVELTLERFLSNNFYYMVNASVFQSKYKTLEGVERNTQYNGNYLVNVLFGKEFVHLGRKKNQTLGLNLKAFVSGGQKIIPLLRDAQGKVAVDPANDRYWDYKKAYQNSLEDVYQIIISASYKWDKRKATHELFINLDNVTNTKGRLSEFYDADKPNSTAYRTQFGFFPNVMYRVYF